MPAFYKTPADGELASLWAERIRLACLDIEEPDGHISPSGFLDIAAVCAAAGEAVVWRS